MKTSELIEKLGRIYLEHGDLEVGARDATDFTADVLVANNEIKFVVKSRFTWVNGGPSFNVVQNIVWGSNTYAVASVPETESIEEPTKEEKLKERNKRVNKLLKRRW